MSSDFNDAFTKLCACLEYIQNDDRVGEAFRSDANTALFYMKLSEELSPEARHILDLLEENGYPQLPSAEGEQARREYAEEISMLHANAKQADSQLI